jgi:hypothetical protein
MSLCCGSIAVTAQCVPVASALPHAKGRNIMNAGMLRLRRHVALSAIALTLTVWAALAAPVLAHTAGLDTGPVIHAAHSSGGGD